VKATQPAYSVVVATHGRASLVERLLETLAKSRAHLSTGSDLEILVVDSSDRANRLAIESACDRFGATLLGGDPSVRRKRNLGARSARGDWLLFIDSDCETSPALFEAYRRATASDPTIAVAAGPTVFREAETPFTRRISRSSLLGPFHRPAGPSKELPWATTSNLLVRRAAFESVGGFREDFPFRLGGDDTDLCLRLRDAGHLVIGVPEAIVFHSWRTWSRPLSVVRRSFRWGWMHAVLLAKHPAYRRIDAPGLPVHFLLLLLLAAGNALAGDYSMTWMPLIFVFLAVILHAVLASVATSRPVSAFAEDLSLAFVELPFGFGRIFGSLARGSFVGVLFRLDIDDSAMDSGFAETVRSLWSDHVALLIVAALVGWAA
jgi:glycosyltransferase involved in cell wall biosynthesis